MPNKKAAIKSLRQDKKKHTHNKATIAELRTLAKKAHVLITENKRDEAETALRELESKLSKASKSNIIKKNTAGRRIGKLRSEFSKVAS
jgi:ribosomal protein S20